ncbi:hypothetical protein [Brevundimonas sp. GCM10030266]|uniref:hypothetical protein n=1 Tax=Brevundimonas sp. GCM10030266 TaxID=3273386 RepID=UPI00361F41E2
MSGWPGWLAGPAAALTFFAVMGVMAWVGARVAGRIVPPRPRATVRSTGAQVTLGCILIAVAVVFLGLGILSKAPARPGQLWPLVGLVVFFSGSGLLMCMAGFRGAVRWDRKGLTQTRLMRRPRTFAWAEITAFEARGSRIALWRDGRRTDLCAIDAEGIGGLLQAAEREGVAGVVKLGRSLPRDRGNRPRS